MDEEERYLGGVSSRWLARGWIRGYAIYVTTKRIIGVKKRREALEEGFLTNKYGGPSVVGVLVDRRIEKHEAEEETKLEKDEDGDTLKELLAKKDLEIEKEEIKQIRLEKPGKLREGHLRIMLKSAQEIGIKMAAPKVFESVGQLMQAFYPEAVELDN